MNESARSFPYSKKCFETTKSTMVSGTDMGEEKEDEVIVIIDPITDKRNVRYYCFLREELKTSFDGSRRLKEWPNGPPIFLLPVAMEKVYYSFMYIDSTTYKRIMLKGKDTIVLVEKRTILIGSSFGVSQLHGSNGDVYTGKSVSREILDVEYSQETADRMIISDEEDMKMTIREIEDTKEENEDEENTNDFESEEDDDDSAQTWYNLNGQLHRDGDLPAVIEEDGTQEWWQNGRLHRENDLPARIDENGTQEWFQNGERHRDNDLPAVIWPDSQMWYQNGLLHRDGDLPAVIWSDGTQMWYQNGRRHRDNNQPAVIDPNGSQEWWRNDKRHRDNGPAVIWVGGRQEWWRDGSRQPAPQS